jgi:hypothetical protein
MSQHTPARYRTTNWPEYNSALCRRGSLLVWLDPQMEWRAAKRGRPGRSEVFSDAAIQFCLSIKVLFGLALRQIEPRGAMGPSPVARRHGGEPAEAGRPGLAGAELLHLCRRQRSVTIQIPFRHSGGNLNLLIDSTGVKVRGDGEWQVRKHGPGRRRPWRKGPLAMDTAIGDIRAVEFTSSQQGDSPVLPDLLAQIPPEQPIGTVTADGAYDTRKCHSAIVERGGTAVIPIRCNGRAWKEDGPAAQARNEILRATQRFGRAFWKRLTGYHARSRIEPQMRRLKAFGERIAARDPNRQAAEIHTRVALMNHFSALGRAEIRRVA